MKAIPDDPIIRCMEDTGFPPWAQEILEDFDDAPVEEDDLPGWVRGVLPLIPFGKANAVRREKLAEQTGLCDRTIREAIEALRRTYIILNDQDGAGYYRSYDPEDIMRSYRQERTRALAILYRLKPMRVLLRGAGLL